MSSKLIVALDFNNKKDALALVDQLEPQWCALKVGSELFTLLGASFIKLLVSRKFRVFLDLKFHDIPTTVARACAICADLGVWMINVHALGGLKMMDAAKNAVAIYGKDRPWLIAVTVLTSFTQEELYNIGCTYTINDQVQNQARRAQEAGLDGVVSSAHEAMLIKNSCGSQFITVTPGIRLASNLADDQTRIMTPKQAIQQGSDYLVIGRPITQSVEPVTVVANILQEIS